MICKLKEGVISQSDPISEIEAINVTLKWPFLNGTSNPGVDRIYVFPASSQVINWYETSLQPAAGHHR